MVLVEEVAVELEEITKISSISINTKFSLCNITNIIIFSKL